MLNEIHNLEVLGVKHNVFVISQNIYVLNFNVIHQLFQKAKHKNVMPCSLQEPSKRESRMSLNHPVLGEGSSPTLTVDYVYPWKFCDILHLL